MVVVVADEVVVALGPEVLVEVLADGVHDLEEAVGVRAGVVDVEGGTGGAGDVEAVVKRLGAVVARTDRDAAVVKEAGEVVPVDAVDVERDEASALLADAGLVRLDEVPLGEFPQKVLSEGVLVGTDFSMPTSSR